MNKMLHDIRLKLMKQGLRVFCCMLLQPAEDGICIILQLLGKLNQPCHSLSFKGKASEGTAGREA